MSKVRFDEYEDYDEYSGPQIEKFHNKQKRDVNKQHVKEKKVKKSK